MGQEYIDSKGHWHHIAQFNGKLNMLKSLVLLAVKTDPNNNSLSARDLRALTGLSITSIKSSLSRWMRWHNRYLIRKGRAKLYQYSLATYGLEFLEILHQVAPLKEAEYLNIIRINRERIESSRIIIPNIPSTIGNDDPELKSIVEEVLSKYKRPQ